MNTEIKIHKLVLSAPSRGLESIEHIIATEQKLNDYAIAQASSLGCIWSVYPVENDGGLLWNVEEIEELKIL